ncbi:MAG TPA: ABC transporter permease [Rhizomicrobium sp.]|jgi:peptide/nickel transport system permease protein|nr:ABC transporter permease [Rhizomicrobium sp.]
MRNFARRFFSRPTALFGFVVFVAVVVIALAAPLAFAAGPFTIVGMPLLPPGSPGLPAGSDVLGRNMMVGLAFGARISLLVGVTSTLGAIGLGVLFGAVAGYYGGVVDDVLMRVTEFFQIIPTFVLLMVLVAFLEPSLASAVIGIALISWPQVARVVRGEFLSLREREFVQAARVLGLSDASIIFGQILPNALTPIVVISSMMVGNAILTESALSFLGLGDPNLLSWGSMIGGSRSAMWVAWWTTVFPGLCIMVTVLSLNFIGDGLNDALNPRRRR